MNNRSRIVTNLRSLLNIIGFMAFLTMAAGVAIAQKAPKVALKPSGEIVSASKTTINGFSAVSGVTVFNNNRITTGKNGGAIINLGRLGRIELGSETDLTLRISETSIGGELRSNKIIVSARAGVGITVNAAEGSVTTDGREPAVLTIYLDGKRPRVVTHLGATRVEVADGGGFERKKESPESTRGEKLRRAALVVGAAGAATAVPMAAYAVTGRATPLSFVRLFRAGVNNSIAPKANNGQGGPEEPFETSITCRDTDQKTCRRKSSYKPERP